MRGTKVKVVVGFEVSLVEARSIVWLCWNSSSEIVSQHWCAAGLDLLTEAARVFDLLDFSSWSC
ncbi:hypothetical protein Droror1_Dr00008499, partial [Drosera rotundifolia]